METRTITQEVFFDASHNEVFEAFMDPKQHAEFTGASADIDRKAGGKFSTGGGHASGTTVEIVKDKKVVQDWRDDKWPAGHFSRLTLNFRPIYDERGTQLSLVQTGVPAESFEGINNGWRDYYWTKLGETCALGRWPRCGDSWRSSRTTLTSTSWMKHGQRTLSFI